MTAGPERQFDQEAYEDAQRERLQDLGVSNNFEATVRVSTGEITIQQAMGSKAVPDKYRDTEDSRYPKHIPAIEHLPHPEPTAEEIEEKRALFIERLIRVEKLSPLQALARSVRPFGPVPRREDHSSSDVA